MRHLIFASAFAASTLFAATGASAAPLAPHNLAEAKAPLVLAHYDSGHRYRERPHWWWRGRGEGSWRWKRRHDRWDDRRGGWRERGAYRERGDRRWDRY